MLDKNGFDLWADGYDRAVGLSDEEGTYPFAGYREVLSRIYGRVLAAGKPHVLDLGFGTAALTAKLYAAGCEIWGQDFSARMLALAREKMPGARLFAGDLAEGLAEPVRRERFDRVIATYSLHHLTDARKVSLLRELIALLRPGGSVLIGDVAFPTRAALEACRRATADWDDEELYIAADELRRDFPSLRFEEVSFCAGIITLTV